MSYLRLQYKDLLHAHSWACGLAVDDSTARAYTVRAKKTQTICPPITSLAVTASPAALSDHKHSS